MTAMEPTYNQSFRMKLAKPTMPSLGRIGVN